MEKRVVAVVVTYNRITLLQECIDALLHQRECTEDILVVDNHSTDETPQVLEKIAAEQERVSVLTLDDNYGGAGGFYYGMKEAMERGYDYIWIMDDDTIPNENALLALKHKMKLLNHTNKANQMESQQYADATWNADRTFGFLSSKVVWTDGTPCKMNGQHRKQTLNARERAYAQDGLVPIDQASFVSLFFSRQAIVRCGLPLKEYFIWGDDKEYTLRVADTFPCYLVEDSVVVHKMNHNAGSNIKLDEVERIPRYYYAYRNDLSTARRRGGKEVAIYFAAFALNVARIIFSTTRHKGERIKTMFSGMKAGMRFSPQIEFAGTIRENKNRR